ncbi:uncharacterized protein NECHADRAFT_79175 [Fusarium vanettenii 77-13-4]|uniref:Uncharacterized protein n=1 Tax=Fusarium vanettenii (strain ATCC MYA-4622 / CBS 123669 / FGSC 9596 / NRRL 45880 / 77-13-4) TaxID=660122 RepID=C7YQP3_FUSV7|nr:uncharacterized protein NECHADRAFT_79175 [Fusarium vanettenii 77-13-4]EEU46505.1 predicted protein [Fusarium vanettenii 77-13-4]
MPPVWGKKYLMELGLESWEQLEKLAKQKLKQDDRDWEAKVAHELSQESTQEATTQRHVARRKAKGKVISYNEEIPTPPRPRRIIKIKVPKRSHNEAQQEHHQAPGPASAGDEQDSDGMSVRSIDDELPNAEDLEFLDDEGNEPEPTGSEASFASGSEDIPMSDTSDSDTSSPEATPDRDLGIDLDSD